MLSGSQKVLDSFRTELRKANLRDIELMESGCHGFCSQGPIVVVKPEEVFYPQVEPEQVQRIVHEHLGQGKIVHDFLFVEPLTEKRIPHYKDINFYKKQTRIVLRNCGSIEPEKIEDYTERDGYEALRRILSVSPDEVINEVKKSGLRGRGGAGFLTGSKWELTRKSAGEKKYIICNADEGDPGAFMDRSVLEGDPHSVLEGMAIAAYAIGADEGYIYVRAEYPLAVRRLQVAIKQARSQGFLGKNILGTPFNFDVHIKQGAGAFVCGEETALILSIEGERGMPRLRPPYPANSGLWGKPTNINNVETFANVPWIIMNGAEKYSSIGTEKSKGTKIFAVTGKVKNSGLVEVPMGTTLREVIFGVCGGIKDDREFKAVQIGGPSGGCLPEELLDTPIDYESIVETGAIMGSGGMVVADEKTCMVDLAKFFLTFTCNESCGKCVPCRLGMKGMLNILTRITWGQGNKEDIGLLKTLARDVKIASLCGLGQTAPNPVLTTLKYFDDEYEMHVKERRCEAGVCEDLTLIAIKENLCQGCGICIKHCPVEAIIGERKEVHHIDVEKCIKCGLCIENCPFDAIYRI
jgi:NADH-quinone oxidoreductase subunit F/NADP-reducing hydrogenase subunit HndC